MADQAEEQLIADAFGQVKVLVEAGEQEGYLQIQPSEVHKFWVTSCDDALVERFSRADPQEVSKWAKATPLGPLINHIQPQDEQQLGKIQTDPITGERHMLVPIEVNLLIDCEKICNLMGGKIDEKLLEQQAIEVEVEVLLGGDQKEHPQEAAIKDTSQKNPKKVSQKKSLKERLAKKSQQKQLPEEMTPQEEPQEQSSTESQVMDEYTALVVVPPINFSLKECFVRGAAHSSKQQEEVAQV